MAFYNVRAPALPLPPPEYLQAQQDQFQNALRLYFNQLDNFTRALASSGGGAALSFPYFSGYQDGITQLTVAIPNATSTAPIQVTSTAGFPSSGYIIIDQEIISYTTTTATQFDGTITRGVLGTTAGKSSHAVNAYVTEAQGSGVGTSASMVIRAVTSSNGVTCTIPDSKVYITNSGLYNIQFSAQFLNYTTSVDNVTIWLRQNGVDVANTAGIQELAPKHGSSPGATIAAWNYYVGAQAGDYIQMCWSSDTGNTIIATYPPGTAPVHPSSPGVILTATFVSGPTP